MYGGRIFKYSLFALFYVLSGTFGFWPVWVSLKALIICRELK